MPLLASFFHTRKSSSGKKVYFDRCREGKAAQAGFTRGEGPRDGRGTGGDHTGTGWLTHGCIRPSR